MITHTWEKLYQCILCEKASMDTTILNKHIMSHTDEKPYQCHDCAKDFINNDTFIEHMNIHNS